MEFPLLSKIVKNKIGLPLFVILSGLTFGFFFKFFFYRLSSTYATFCAAVMVLPFIVAITGNIKYLLWTGLIVCLPITVDFTLNHTGHESGAAGYIISIYDMILLALYVLWIFEMVSKKKIEIKFFSVISIPAFFLIGMACLSMVVAQSSELSKFEILEVVKMYLSFLYLANNIKNENEIKFIITLLILCLFFEGTLGFAQHRYDEPFFPTALGGPGWINSRVKGTWLSYNDFAWYLTFFLPLPMSMIFSKIKPSYKLFCLLTLSVASASLMWTNARTGWISFGISLLFVLLFVFTKARHKKGTINFFATILALIILTSPVFPRLSEKIYGRFASDDGGSADSRWPQFEVAFNIINANPFFGIGINNYTLVMNDYDTTEEGLEEITLFQVHNIFLQIAAEMGIIGLIIFIWFLAVIYFIGLEYIIKNDDFMVYSVIGMLAGIIAFLLHGLYDAASLGSKMFLFNWFFAGVICAIAKISTKQVHIKEVSLKTAQL